MDTLIRLKATGNAFDFASKLDISKDSIYRLIEFMKIDLEAPIVYNKHQKTFEYSTEGRLNIGFELQSIATTEMEKIKGGSNYNLSKNFAISQLLRNTAPTFGIVQYPNNPGFW